MKEDGRGCKMARRKVLVIAYYFPPSGTAGTYRTLKFVKYLSEFGYQPIVLTAKENSYGRLDYDVSLLREVPPDIKIIRTPTFEPRFVLKLLAKLGMSRLARATFVLDPDVLLTWVLPVIWVGLRIIKRENVELIYSSSSPHGVHLGALVLSKLTHKPWVADFRDPWTGHEYFDALNALYEKIAQGAELLVVKTASRTIMTSSGHKRMLLSRYPDVDPSKVVVITNGYDEEDFSGIVRDGHKKFTIAYTGWFYDEYVPVSRQSSARYRVRRFIEERVFRLRPPRPAGDTHSPAYFLRALRALLDERPEIEAELCVNLVGKVSHRNRQLIYDLHLERVVYILGHVPHREAISYLINADVLLLVLGSKRGHSCFLPGKLYEYMGAGKPILALIPDGDAKDLILATNTGVVVNPRDINAIKEAIYDLYLKYKSGVPATFPNMMLVQQYERRNLTQRLALLFTEILDERSL